MSRHDYEKYAQDAAILGEIGKVLFPQDTKLSVRLPRHLADQALAAWRRDELNAKGAARAAEETPEQQVLRTRAAYLALIGLCIENTGQPCGDEVSCELDAWYIGSALQAAEEQGLLIS
ncbi:MAG TPA: hypothetical protein VN969_02105 [Streptosporangiaceae bacterium]|nr:hypothetical protein [Streptosporangiaceae bacterium]